MKFDIHTHTNLDPIEGKNTINHVSYTPEQLFAKAQKKGLTALSLTHHTKLVFSKKLEQSAKKFGILLIPGIEAVIEEADVIILNPLKESYSTFEEIAEEKKKNPHAFIFAPHPYYPMSCCLLNKLDEHIDLFDGIEQCHFYLSWIDKYNTMARKTAKKYKKKLIATGDIHDLYFVGRSFSEMKSNPKNPQQFVKALKTERIISHSRPLSLFSLLRIIFQHKVMANCKKIWHRNKCVQ